MAREREVVDGRGIYRGWQQDKERNRQESRSSLRLPWAQTTNDDLPKKYQVKVREISKRRVDDTDRDERGLSRGEVDEQRHQGGDIAINLDEVLLNVRPTIAESAQRSRAYPAVGRSGGAGFQI